MRTESCICMADDNAKAAVDVDLCGTLKVGGGQPVVAVCASNARDVVGALCARDSKGIGSQYVDEGKVICMDGCETEGRKYVVRRLTPVECERLQGFPDDFTKVPYKGKPADECPDGPRYKALGNSMAVPVIEWIGRRIEAVCGDGD